MSSQLHMHSEYSMLDGFGTPRENLDRAREIGSKAIAITEHANVYSWVYYGKLSKEYPDIKIIYGSELYECFDMNVQDKDNKYFHLIALAKNEAGRIAINEIITTANFKGFYNRPRIDLEHLKPYANDLIITTACLASKLSRENDYQKCIEYINEYKSIFPYFYLEMQSHSHADQELYNQKILKLSKDTNTPFIITCDSHAATKDDLYYQARHVQVAHDSETMTEVYEGCYLQSDDEIHEIMDSQIGKDNVDIGLITTDIISDLIETVKIPFQEPQLPDFPLQDGFEDNLSFIKHLIDIGWENRNFNNKSLEEQQKYKERMKYELQIIDSMGYTAYFLIVWDFINFAKENNIMIAPGRGSCAGSLVCYLLGITDLDPIKYGLIFERFLNPERVSMPDTDTDTDDRASIIAYLTNKYGEDSVCQIINFSYITPVVAIKDVGRVLNIPYKVCDKISKKFGYETFEECMENNPNILNEYPQYHELFNVASHLSGRVHHVSVHAGGVGIVNTKITNYMAMKLGSDGEHVIQVDKKMIEEIGIIKFDILGVQTLGVIKEVLTDIGLSEYDININNLEFENDKRAFELLSKAQTNGVFQVESAGMKDLLIRLKPENMQELCAVISLFRPDSMNVLEGYIRNKHNPNSIEYLHEDMKPIYAETYGCMVYQEQMLEVVKKFGGRTYGGADLFRKGIGKKDKKLVQNEAHKLYQEIIDNGYIEEIAKTISDDLADKGGYSFNKCISGSTKLYRAGTKFSKYVPTVEEMFLIKNGDFQFAKETNHQTLRKKYKRYGYGNALSMYDDFRIRTNKIVDIRQSGIRCTYEVKTKSGTFISCTMNHKFPTPNGERKLEELKIGDLLYVIGKYEECKNTYNLTDGDFIPNYPTVGEQGFQNNPNGVSVIYKNKKEEHHRNKDSCKICGTEYSIEKRFELHHKDFDRTNNRSSNFEWLCVGCHKKEHYKNKRVKVYEKGIPAILDEIISIEYCGEEMTYDIEMEDPAHNFLTKSGLVTSNSHGMSYAVLCLQTAYLKYHHPLHFYKALLNNNKDKTGMLNKYIIDAKQFDIHVLPPSISKSGMNFTVADGKILFGLSAIKGIGENFAKLIIEERNKSKFVGLYDFIKRLNPKKNQIISLIKSGAIPAKDKKQTLIKYFNNNFECRDFEPVSSIKKHKEMKEIWGIDCAIIKDKDERLRLYNEKKLTQHNENEKLRYKKYVEENQKYFENQDFWEFEALSIFINDNPFAKIYDYIDPPFEYVEIGNMCVIVGIIANITKKKDKNKKQFAFLNIYSTNGTVEAICWHTQLKEYEDLITKGSRVAILCKKEGEDKVIIEEMRSFEKWLEIRKIKL